MKHIQRTYLIKRINDVADFKATTADVVQEILDHIKENYQLKDRVKFSITKKSTLTGEVSTKFIVMSEDQYNRYLKGEELVQNIFPELSTNDREFLISGSTPEEWKQFMEGDDNLPE